MKFLKKYQSIEQSSTMIGWDFSLLKDVLEEETLPFAYFDVVSRYRRDTMEILDMETGG